MMKLELDEIMLLIKGLDASIELKEYEILEINERTEDDYRTKIQLKERMNKEWDLESLKRYDISRVRDEICEIERLRNVINSGKHHVLMVPTDIRLELRESR